MKQPKIDFTKYSIEDLKSTIQDIENYLYEYDDGHVYVCVFLRYGTRGEEAFSTWHIPEKYSEEYNGD